MFSRRAEPAPWGEKILNGWRERSERLVALPAAPARLTSRDTPVPRPGTAAAAAREAGAVRTEAGAAGQRRLAVGRGDRRVVPMSARVPVV